MEDTLYVYSNSGRRKILKNIETDFDVIFGIKKGLKYKINVY